MSPEPAVAARAVPALAPDRLVRPALLVGFSYIFLANAWIGDDAQISFRSAWNLIHGYGLTFNPDERVQAFTDPLWTLLVAAVHAVTGEFFFTVTALSWVLNVIAGAVLLRRTRSLGVAALVAGWALSSKALVDYTSSGLEYPLAYLLVALFYARYLSLPAGLPPALRDLRALILIASLGFVTRVDMLVLFAAPVTELTIRAFRAHGRQALRPVIVGVLPAVAWTLFATFYYGFPLPNTYYAKVANGLPSWLQRQQGWAYLFNSLRFDPITLSTIALGALVSGRGNRATRFAALSAVLYVGYTVNVGGDFMSGRFFALPFLIAIVIVSRMAEPTLVPWAGVALVAYNVMMPLVPIKTLPASDAGWAWRTQNGIKDERGITHQSSNLLSFAPFRPLADTPFARDGLNFAASPQHASIYCCIGAYGLTAGPTKYVLDENALSDPLLARLPVSPRVYFDFWASHYFRDLPAGYLESVETNENRLTDPLLHGYYERLRHVTRGPLFSLARLRDVAVVNLSYRDLHHEYEKHRAVILSIPASHDRFKSVVGVRDGAGLHANGQPGYLEFGPTIPMKAGFYRARWVASVAGHAPQDLGAAEVWADGQLLSRQPVRFDASRAEHAVVAAVDFSLKDDVRALDYRFYVNAAAPVILERVELYSGLAIPPSE